MFIHELPNFPNFSIETMLDKYLLTSSTLLTTASILQAKKTITTHNSMVANPISFCCSLESFARSWLAFRI